MNRTPLQNLLKLKLFSGGSEAPTEELTATGNPATFTTDVKKALTGMTIPFTPIQSGSGTPSTENVRPIAGYTGITISASGEDTSNPHTYAIEFHAATGTVYGGTVDAIAGTLSVEWVKYTFTGNEPQFVQQTNKVAVKAFASAKAVSTHNAYCTQFAAQAAGDFAYITTSMTADELKTYFASNNVDIAYQLATPVTYQLTAQQIKTVLGENNVWTDTNGTNTVKYLKKVST